MASQLTDSISNIIGETDWDDSDIIEPIADSLARTWLTVNKMK